MVIALIINTRSVVADGAGPRLARSAALGRWLVEGGSTRLGKVPRQVTAGEDGPRECSRLVSVDPHEPSRLSIPPSQSRTWKAVDGVGIGESSPGARSGRWLVTHHVSIGRRLKSKAREMSGSSDGGRREPDAPVEYEHSAPPFSIGRLVFGRTIERLAHLLFPTNIY
jgi:hypothetical protein